MAESIIGRDDECKILKRSIEAGEAELIAVYGRRRVGKTHLIREFFKPLAGTYLEVTGEKEGSRLTQLHHFREAISKVFFAGKPLPELANWRRAFSFLADMLEQRASERPNELIVVFLDEVPWLSTRRSGLVPALDHCWNTRLAAITSLRLVVCGSAASWMLDHLVHAKGGLYNRITRRIALQPFNLQQTSVFLAKRGIRLQPKDVADLYMALGGIPLYLKQVSKGESAAQTIGEVCFDRHGILHDEFPKLFSSLFDESEQHESIVRVLGGVSNGLTRGEIVDKTGTTDGGRLKKRLDELTESGFVASFVPYGRRTKDTTYRLIDEYSMFYLRWIEPAPRGVLAGRGAPYWLNKTTTPAYLSWAGYAFESLCLKHAAQLQAALGMDGVAAEPSTWQYRPPKGAAGDGAQIDLLFDRADDAIMLCELKYCRDVFAINKAYARTLKRKLEIFDDRTKTKKRLFLAMVTPYGMKPTIWSEDLVDQTATLDGLFS